MKICIDEKCYKILRVIKNGVSYETSFLENARDNRNASTMINDAEGNILLCRKMIDYELDPVDNIWKSIEPKLTEPTDTEVETENE